MILRLLLTIALGFWVAFTAAAQEIAPVDLGPEVSTPPADLQCPPSDGSTGGTVTTTDNPGAAAASPADAVGIENAAPTRDDVGTEPGTTTTDPTSPVGAPEDSATDPGGAAPSPDDQMVQAQSVMAQAESDEEAAPADGWTTDEDGDASA